jgi:hypothetical protein
LRSTISYKRFRRRGRVRTSPRRRGSSTLATGTRSPARRGTWDSVGRLSLSGKRSGSVAGVSPPQGWVAARKSPVCAASLPDGLETESDIITTVHRLQCRIRGSSYHAAASNCCRSCQQVYLAKLSLPGMRVCPFAAMHAGLAMQDALYHGEGEKCKTLTSALWRREIPNRSD